MAIFSPQVFLLHLDPVDVLHKSKYVFFNGVIGGEDFSIRLWNLKKIINKYEETINVELKEDKPEYVNNVS